MRSPWSLFAVALGGVTLGLLAAPLAWRAAPAAWRAPWAAASPGAAASAVGSPASSSPRASTPSSGAAGQPSPSSAASPPPDLRRQQLIGVRTARVVEADVSPAIRTVGIVKPDERRRTEITLKTAGWIRDLHVDYTGAPVRKGQPLFTLYSPELLATQQEYLLARRGRARVDETSVAETRAYADRLVHAARQRLALWDISPDQILALDRGEPPQPSITFRSPVDGVVMEKALTRGMQAAAGQRLYTLVDLSTVWIEADLRESDLAAVGPRAAHARASMTFDAFPGRTFSGAVTFVAPTMDPESRTVKARIELPNPRGLLKPGLFATVTLTPAPRRGLVVPADAVLDSGTIQTVFVSEGDGHFEPRRIRIGRRLGETIEVLEGLRVNEEVARSATFFLDADSQLRAALDAYAPAPATPAGAASPAAPAMPAMPRMPGMPAPATPATSASAPAAGLAKVAITYRSDPDPPAGGRENLFEVQLRDEAGAPVTDASVSIVFFMAAMPSMNMPAMRSETALVHAGGGLYRGRGQILMSGPWDAQVTATRGGRRLGLLRRSVVAQ